MSSGSGGGGLEIDSAPRVDGTQTSQAPHGPAKSSPKCAATCSCRQTRVSAKPITRSARDSATSARAIEQCFDALARVVRRRRHLDPHQPALVEAAPNETGLLEHPDENASVSLRHECGEVVRLDEPVGVPQRAVDSAELRRRRHVRHREPSQCRRIARAREQERLARLAVPARATDHLDVALERVRIVDEADEPYVRLVDTHPERGRRDHCLRSSGDEAVLDPRPLARLEAGVVVLCAESVAAENARELLGRAPGACIDDRGSTAQGAKPIHEDRDPVLRVGDLCHLVAQVRAHHARVDDLERAPECFSDVARGLRRRGGGHPEQRRFAECLEAPPDEEVVGAEVVSPHAHAVHLVHHDEPDPDVGEEIHEARLPQALGCRIDEARLPRRDAG